MVSPLYCNTFVILWINLSVTMATNSFGQRGNIWWKWGENRAKLMKFNIKFQVPEPLQQKIMSAQWVTCISIHCRSDFLVPSHALTSCHDQHVNNSACGGHLCMQLAHYTKAGRYGQSIHQTFWLPPPYLLSWPAYACLEEWCCHLSIVQYMNNRIV